MIPFAITIFFVVWVAISITYIFYSKGLGKFGDFLRRYGWVHKWAMFTSSSGITHKIAIYFRDKNEFDDISDWQRVVLSKPSTLNFLLNVQERIFVFYISCIMMLNKRKLAGNKYSVNDPVFKFLCALVCDLPSPIAGKRRQIKIIEISNEHTNAELATSEFLVLNEH